MRPASRPEDARMRALGCLIWLASAAAWAFALVSLGREIVCLIGGH